VRLLEKSGGRSGHWRRESAGESDEPAGAGASEGEL
jgi:hypothetical protein